MSSRGKLSNPSGRDIYRSSLAIPPNGIEEAISDAREELSRGERSLDLTRRLVFAKEYNYTIKGRNTRATVVIRRREDGLLEFGTFLRYDDGKPVLKHDGTEVNFSLYLYKELSESGLRKRAEELGARVELPEDYEKLRAERERINAEIEEIDAQWRTKTKFTRRQLAKPLYERIDEISRKTASMYAEAALKVIGEQVIKELPERLRFFVESPKSDQEVYLANLLEFAAVPETGKGDLLDSKKRRPGSYGSGKRSR